MRVLTAILFWLIILFAVFALYSAAYFCVLQDISTPKQIPRVRYDRNFWFALFMVSVLADFGLHLYRSYQDKWDFKPKESERN